ncbi:MAG: hypothetical protein ACTSVA_03035 [Candidatus Njordarchaeales archaeon]
MSSVLRYLAINNVSLSAEKEEEKREDMSNYDDVSYAEFSPASIKFISDTGVLTINFNIHGDNVEVLETDALVLITLIDGKLADIELLLTNKDIIKKLSAVLGPHSD